MNVSIGNETLKRAQQLIADDLPERAEELLTKLFHQNNHTFEVLIERVLCNLLMERDDIARHFLELAESISGYERHSRVLCYHGFLAMVDKAYDTAMTLFEESLVANPANAEAYKWRGLCFRELGEPERAIADLDRAAFYLRDDPTLLINRGTVYADLGELELALRDFERACERAPHHAHPHFNAGHILVEMGRHLEAREHYDRAIELDFLAVEAWMGLAGTCALHHEWSEALRCLSTVLAIEPESLEANFRLGQVFLELAAFDQAAAHFDTVLDLAPADPEALSFRAVARFHLERFDDALDDCERAVSGAPELGLPRLYRALSRLEMGVAPEDGPLADLEQALALAPGHPGPPLVLAELAAGDGRHDDAYELLSQALSLDPRIRRRLSDSPQLAALLENPNPSQVSESLT